MTWKRQKSAQQPSNDVASVGNPVFGFQEAKPVGAPRDREGCSRHSAKLSSWLFPHHWGFARRAKPLIPDLEALQIYH